MESSVKNPNPLPIAKSNALSLTFPPRLPEKLFFGFTCLTDHRLRQQPGFIINMKRCRKASSFTEKESVEPVDIEDLNFSSDEAEKIRACLLDWYDQNMRDLPWRKPVAAGNDETRAYAVWVSEIMLQQTRVQTVVDFYTRWMEKWPTIHHLSLASIEEVNEMWAGLGYYRRARFLLEGAKKIVEGGGEFPKTVSSLHLVNGIGKYTAGAIASIAFGEAVPVVDGNVVRVIARLKAISDNPKKSATVNNLWRLAKQLVDPVRPGDFNQGVMELGATVCTAKNPRCTTCPISHQCQALALAVMHESVEVVDYPLKVAKAKQRHEFCSVCVVEIVGRASESNSSFLLVRRPDTGLLAGLWEFPSVNVDKEAEISLRRKLMDCLLMKSFCLDINEKVSRDDVGVVVHVFSHIRLKMYVELMVLEVTGEVDVLQKNKDGGGMICKYVDSKELATLGLTSGVRKVYNMIEKFKQKSGNKHKEGEIDTQSIIIGGVQ